MAQSVKVIYNPAAGRANQAKILPRLQEALQNAGLDYQIAVTEHRQHATELAQQAAVDKWPRVAVAGGDGTINEVVNGLLQVEGERPQLGLLPLGTANDLTKTLEIPTSLSEACQKLAQSTSRRIDVGQVNQHYFVNNSAIGLEPLVTMQQERLRWLGGSVRYIVAAMQSIVTARFWEVHLDWLSGVYEGPVLLISVGNSPRTGGFFFMTPQAEVSDGLFDFVYGIKMSRWQMVNLLPRTMNGSHIRHPLVIYRRAETINIRVEPTTPIQADGEIIETAANEITYQILPDYLEVVA